MEFGHFEERPRGIGTIGRAEGTKMELNRGLANPAAVLRNEDALISRSPLESSSAQVGCLDRRDTDGQTLSSAAPSEGML